MRILQNIKEAFGRIFPLHLNSTVMDLEDDLGDAEFVISCQESWNKALNAELDAVAVTNAEYRKENLWLNEGMTRLREGNKALNAELDAVYQSMTPKLSSWPMPISSHLEDSRFPELSFIRVELPPLRLCTAVNEAVRRGLYSGYIETFASHIADTARKEVKEAVSDILQKTLPIKK